MLYWRASVRYHRLAKMQNRRSRTRIRIRKKVCGTNWERATKKNAQFFGKCTLSIFCAVVYVNWKGLFCHLQKWSTVITWALWNSRTFVHVLSTWFFRNQWNVRQRLVSNETWLRNPIIRLILVSRKCQQKDEINRFDVFRKWCLHINSRIRLHTSIHRALRFFSCSILISTQRSSNFLICLFLLSVSFCVGNLFRHKVAPSNKLALITFWRHSPNLRSKFAVLPRFFLFCFFRRIGSGWLIGTEEKKKQATKWMGSFMSQFFTILFTYEAVATVGACCPLKFLYETIWISIWRQTETEKVK